MEKVNSSIYGSPTESEVFAKRMPGPSDKARLLYAECKRKYVVAMPAPRYHIYLEYDEHDEKSGIRFNLSIEELDRTFLTPFKAGKPFWFLGKLLNPSTVHKTIIFWSFEDGGTLVLPNREMVAGNKDKRYVMERICAGKVKGVTVCTEKFLTHDESG